MEGSERDRADEALGSDPVPTRVHLVCERNRHIRRNPQIRSISQGGLLLACIGYCTIWHSLGLNSFRSQWLLSWHKLEFVGEDVLLVGDYTFPVMGRGVKVEIG